MTVSIYSTRQRIACPERSERSRTAGLEGIEWFSFNSTTLQTELLASISPKRMEQRLKIACSKPHQTIRSSVDGIDMVTWQSVGGGEVLKRLSIPSTTLRVNCT